MGELRVGRQELVGEWMEELPYKKQWEGGWDRRFLGGAKTGKWDNI